MQQPVERRGDNWHLPVDVVVSSRATHHVPSRRKQLLCASIYNALVGGVFLNLDGARPTQEALRELYRAAGGRPPCSRPDEERARLSGHYIETLDEQLNSFAPPGSSWVTVSGSASTRSLSAGTSRVDEAEASEECLDGR